ncbi:hypothetical protein [Pseudomonas arcuscaelestis]|uniref:hypothetical protein n=1 Tax=Pseudomonas arcuscaelestis TaxID=2710591 RepID=UPI00193C90E0|nr:hypothetical protein [Pseudomonas arcuscaelestis]MBM3111652.1 hypothetical protein [Pseudomonas arcuscaelestis]
MSTKPGAIQALVKDELDAFEKFAEEYFEKILGGVVLAGTTRGPDNDLDLKIQLNGETVLVSCKHYADGDNAVGADQEYDPVSAIYSNGCTKFIGFYSTVPSAPLITKLEGLKSNKSIPFDYEILKNSDIESRLLDKDNVVGWLFAARYFPVSYANLFRRFVVPIEHYKEKDLKKITSTSWRLDGPFGGTSSGAEVDKAQVVQKANDALTNNVHASFFSEALKDAIDCFPEYFKYRADADLQALENSDVSPCWDRPLTYESERDCSVPIMVCGLWSFWCPRRALEKYLIFMEASELLNDPPDSKALIIARAQLSLTYSSFLSPGNIALRSSGKYRDIFARLTAFCQLSLEEYKGANSASFRGEAGERIIWNFKVGEGLNFLFDRVLGN